MKTEVPQISGQWNVAYERMLNHFSTLRVEGDRGLLFVREISLGDLYVFTISQRGADMNVTVTCWKKVHDYGRWRTEVMFSPTLIVESTDLPEDEAKDFAAFFDALCEEEEDKLLVERGVLILDGEQFRMSLFRNGSCMRSFSWNSATDAVGLMERVLKFSTEKAYRK